MKANCFVCGCPQLALYSEEENIYLVENFNLSFKEIESGEEIHKTIVKQFVRCLSCGTMFTPETVFNTLEAISNGETKRG